MTKTIEYYEHYLGLGEFFERFHDYVYRVAASQSEQQIELLVSTMPDLLGLCISRPDKLRRDLRMLSVPWAIFADESIYTEAAKKCLRMLRRIGFRPNGHFHDRLCRDGQLELLEDYLKVFEIDSSVTSDGAASMLAYCAAGITTVGGCNSLDRLRLAIECASDVSAPTGFNGGPVLHNLFQCGSSDEAVQDALKGIEMFLDRGARIDQVGLIKGWAHNNGDGEYLPLLHQAYWRKYTGRCNLLIVKKAESICDASQQDSQGRTAAEYLEQLVQMDAPK